ncbi:MAG: hypothetical protein EP330_23890 [Deltaproteobacteria bacterium]|nr:MAG: hypothetical protein EP330_23890 [Deltaproteobacteria bacterium]
MKPHHAVAASMFLLSFALVLFELVLTRLFGVILFASFAHLALALAMLGISFGAVLQHLNPNLVPDEGLEERLGWLSLIQGGTTVIAVLACLTFPVTVQFEQPPVHYGERSSIAWNLVDPMWFTALMAVLAVPFVVVGLSFAGVFQRRKEHIGLIYGADLIGGAIGGVAFIPLLYMLPAPDVLWIVTGVTAASAVLLFQVIGEARSRAVAALALVASLLLTGVATTGTEILNVRYAAGYSEDNVEYTRWTPLTRLAVHTDDRGTFMLLDNSSASHVVLTQKEKDFMARSAARAFVYRMHPPGSRIAILAASAGPEVAAAQAAGHTDIDAVDIAAEIGEIVATRWPDNPVNPYVNGGTRRVWSDGRAAILHAEEPYDIIHMVHANLHSNAGLMANAWSPNLLQTKEAFHTYLDHLSEDGTICFAAQGQTRHFVRAAAEALKERGVERPGDHILFVGGNQIFMLLKKRPFTPEEQQRAKALVQRWPGKQEIISDPLERDLGIRRQYMEQGPVMTDNRPYHESADGFLESLDRSWRYLAHEESVEARPVDIIYNSLILQALLAVVAGSMLVLVPLMRRGPIGLTDVHGVAFGLLYACGLGYGYLGVETVLIHELVLFVGHPVYAVTVVICTMLLFSGLGSIVVGRLADEDLTRKLQGVLVAVLALGLFQAFVVPGVLYESALGLPIVVRIGLTALFLAPLGFVMGMPFPMFLRVLRPEAAGMVPWAWAFNGWMSVVASLGTVFVSRLYGYHQAFGVAIAAYLLALAMSPKLGSIGKR